MTKRCIYIFCKLGTLTIPMCTAPIYVQGWVILKECRQGLCQLWPHLKYLSSLHVCARKKQNGLNFIYIGHIIPKSTSRLSVIEVVLGACDLQVVMAVGEASGVELSKSFQVTIYIQLTLMHTTMPKLNKKHNTSQQLGIQLHIITVQ